MRKASFHDKYIEVCENTLQDPNGVVVKGALLAHLKLNVSPVVGCGKDGITTTTTTGNKKKSKSIKCMKGESPLQRKRCLRNFDARTRAEKARGIAVFEERIICGEDNNNNINKLELLGATTTQKDYLIPDDIKKQILIANGLETRVTTMEDGCPVDVTTTKPTEQLVDENGNNVGTYFTIQYRSNNNNKRTFSSTSTSSNMENKHHHYVQVEHLKRASSVSEAEEEDGSESPYSTARDLGEKMNYMLPKYYVIDDELCEHGLTFPNCFECDHGTDDPIYSEPSSSCGDSDSYKESRCQQQLPPDWLPGQYLKQTVIEQNSNGSGVSTDDGVDGDRIYYCLEELQDDVEEDFKWQNGMGKLQNQRKLCDIEEAEESDEDEIFV